MPLAPIRPARIAERDALIALEWRAATAHETYRAALLANPEAVDLPAVQIENGSVWVFDRDGALAGFAVILPRTDNAVELDGLFVEPAFWRGGIGRALVGHCIGIARARCATALFVTANPDALAFYEACHFVTIGEDQTQFGPAPRMRLDL